MTRLSVNVNKIALLRNSRGGDDPDVVRAARTCLDAGAHGITVHPRPDGRHVRTPDVHRLAALCGEYEVEFNLEGNPFAAPRPGYPGFLALCEAVRPAQATLVPDTDGQLTSDHGFDFDRDLPRLTPVVQRLREWGCRVSLFADTTHPALARAGECGAQRVELYTGPYAEGHARGDSAPLQACIRAARAAQDAGLEVNAGHDLSQHNLGDFLRAVPAVVEVSIGHALIGEALYAGLDTTVRRYLEIIKNAAH
ncbi:pyridoxine 5'-phosphate synthase [Luteimonas sp. e5]